MSAAVERLRSLPLRRIAVTVATVTALGLAAVWALSAAHSSAVAGWNAGLRAGAEHAPAAADPELPVWLPAGTDRDAALAAMREGRPMQISTDEIGCKSDVLLLPSGEVWWLRAGTAEGRVLTDDLSGGRLPRLGCFDLAPQ